MGGEQSGATARITADGRIRFTAPTARTDREETVRVDFAVTDGRSAPVKRSMTFRVQAPLDQTSFAAQAQPDVIRGEVGTPIKIRPLLNDLPGSDPTSTNAELVLGGKVPPQAGATIVSDLDSGQLTFTGDRAGTYFLKYDAGFGNATLDQGTIRVDVKPRPKRASDPIAMPDQLTVYGQAPGIVDVLSNDLDPAGGLLVVQRAVPTRAGSIDVAIIDGRWLRISSRQPDMAPATQTISYTISNGTSSAVRGEVVVTQRPAPQDNTPVTVADRVVVRAGSAVSAPVLDNDLSPSGDRLTLLSDLSDGLPGQLEVVRPPDVTGDLGQAFVSGRLVRYVAPANIKERDTYEVTYIAQNLDGQRAVGRLFVTVVPVDDPNDPPEPPTLEGRVVSATRSRSASRESEWTATATRSRSPASRQHPAWAGSSPSAATSSSTRPTRAPSGRTSSPTPWSTPRARSPRAWSGSPWCHPASRSRRWLSPTGSRSSRDARRRSTRWPTTSSRPGTTYASSSSTLRQVPGSTRTPTW